MPFIVKFTSDPTVEAIDRVYLWKLNIERKIISGHTIMCNLESDIEDKQSPQAAPLKEFVQYMYIHVEITCTW